MSSTDLRTAAEERGLRPVVVCAPQLRAAVRRMVAPALPSTAVLSYTELVGATRSARSAPSPATAWR